MILFEDLKMGLFEDLIAKPRDGWICREPWLEIASENLRKEMGPRERWVSERWVSEVKVDLS